MTTETTTLTAFLLEAIAADEAEADQIHEVDCDLIRNGRVDPTFGWTCDCDVPARILATCAAHRAIVNQAGDILAATGWDYVDAPVLAEFTLRALASVYADRDGFDASWVA